MSRRVRRWFRPVGLYALGLLWGAALLVAVRRHLDADRRSRWRSDGLRALALAAAGLGDPGLPPSFRSTRVRRLSGEPDTRFAALWTAAGDPVVVFGPAPCSRAPAAWTDGSADRLEEDPGDSTASVFLSPLWREGKKAGVLSWGRWRPLPGAAGEAEGRALWAAFLWWAAAGALGIWGIGRRRTLVKSRPPAAPLDNPPFEG